MDVSFNIITHAADAEKVKVLLHTLPKSVEVVIVETVHDATLDGAAERFVTTVKGRQTIDDREIVVAEFRYGGQFHFAAARNAAKMLSTRGWICWVDSDDSLTPQSHEVFATLDELPRGVGGLWGMVFGLNAIEDCPEHQTDYYSAKQVRIFRNLPEIIWEGDAHEQILPSIEKQLLQVLFSELYIYHSGYVTNRVTAFNKMLRNVMGMCRSVGTGTDTGAFHLGHLPDSINTLQRLAPKRG